MHSREEREQAIDAVLVIGLQMSNLCYNLSQRKGEPVSDSNRSAMAELVRKWDAASGRLRESTKRTENPRA